MEVDGGVNVNIIVNFIMSEELTADLGPLGA